MNSYTLKPWYECQAKILCTISPLPISFDFFFPCIKTLIKGVSFIISLWSNHTCGPHSLGRVENVGLWKRGENLKIVVGRASKINARFVPWRDPKVVSWPKGLKQGRRDVKDNAIMIILFWHVRICRKNPGLRTNSFFLSSSCFSGTKEMIPRWLCSRI